MCQVTLLLVAVLERAEIVARQSQEVVRHL